MFLIFCGLHAPVRYLVMELHVEIYGRCVGAWCIRDTVCWTVGRLMAAVFSAWNFPSQWKLALPSRRSRRPTSLHFVFPIRYLPPGGFPSRAFARASHTAVSLFALAPENIRPRFSGSSSTPARQHREGPARHSIAISLQLISGARVSWMKRAPRQLNRVH